MTINEALTELKFIVDTLEYCGNETSLPEIYETIYNYVHIHDDDLK